MSTPGAVEGALPERGEIFDGKYRIDGVLGIDGMGALLAATRLDRNERVALKVLLPDSADDAVVRHSTLAGLGSSKIRSDYVARTPEAGIYRGRPYLVVEYRASLDPRELVDQGGIRVTPPSARERLAQPAPTRAPGPSQRTSVPRVPMRSAIPGYSLAGMAVVAIVATAGWAVWHQGRALREAEARTEAPTLAPLATTPVPALPLPPAVDTTVTTTSAVVTARGSTEPTRTPVSAATPAAPSPAAPAPRHHHSHAKPTRAATPPPARASSLDNPYTSPAPGTPAEPGAGSSLFEIRK